MGYNIITTDKMDELLDNCIGYILQKFQNEQAARHLLSKLDSMYDMLEINPMIYQISDDPFLSAMKYHEAKVDGMEYIVIYKVDNNNVYILGIFHTLENYADKMKIIWDM